jgi:hypothetical protein
MGILKKYTPYIKPYKYIVFEVGDKLIVVATDKSYEFIEESLFDIKPYFNNRPYVFSSRKILTLGFNKSIFYVVKDMEHYVVTDSTLTMLLPNESNQFKIASKFESKTLLEKHFLEKAYRKSI